MCLVWFLTYDSGIRSPIGVLWCQGFDLPRIAALPMTVCLCSIENPKGPCAQIVYEYFTKGQSIYYFGKWTLRVTQNHLFPSERNQQQSQRRQDLRCNQIEQGRHGTRAAVPYCVVQGKYSETLQIQKLRLSNPNHESVDADTNQSKINQDRQAVITSAEVTSSRA